MTLDVFCKVTMKKIFFQKRSIGFAALASLRDWVIVLVIAAGFFGLCEAALRWSLMDTHTMHIVLIGIFFGMLPSVLMCVPVHGVVDGLSRDALHSFLQSMKFTRSFERNNVRFFTQDTPAWARWDSNCVAVKSLPDGQLSVAMPLYCYRILKKRIWR
jgi:hypothetical protein